MLKGETMQIGKMLEKTMMTKYGVDKVRVRRGLVRIVRQGGVGRCGLYGRAGWVRTSNVAGRGAGAGLRCWRERGCLRMACRASRWW